MLSVYITLRFVSHGWLNILKFYPDFFIFCYVFPTSDSLLGLFTCSNFFYYYTKIYLDSWLDFIEDFLIYYLVNCWTFCYCSDGVRVALSTTFGFSLN